MASKLFGEVPFEVLSRIALWHLGEAPRQAELLRGGLFNTSYKLTFKGESPAVLRLGPLHEELLLPFEAHLIHAEAEACALLAGAGIPGNRVLAVDEGRALVDRGYMLFEYLDAIPLSSLVEGDTRLPGLMAQTGGYAAQIHAIEGPWFGRLSNGYRGIRHASWLDFLLADAGENAGCCREAGILSGAQVEAVGRAFMENSACFQDIHTPRLVHGDLWGGNVLVDAAGKLVLAIIDIDRSIWGDPDFDLANPWMINKDFLGGYGRELPEGELQVKKRLLYRLLYALADAYVWRVEYDNAEESLKQVDTIEGIFEKVLI